MFGYVRAFQPELKVRELEEYKAVYCGLCHSLGRRYGAAARFSLSYDFTFLAMLGMAVADGPAEICEGRCAFNPLRKVPACRRNAALDYSADIAAVSIYHKLRDTLRDEGFFKRLGARTALLLAAPAYRRAKADEPEAAAAFDRAMARQPEAEKAPDACLDAACAPTAEALGAVFAQLSSDPGKRRILARMGYLMGRYVYMADALDDLDKDKKSGAFNPFASGSREDAAASLYLTIGEIGTAYDLLDKRRFGSVLDNIVYLGLRATADRVRVPPEQRSVKRYERSL